MDLRLAEIANQDILDLRNSSSGAARILLMNGSPSVFAMPSSVSRLLAAQEVTAKMFQSSQRLDISHARFFELSAITLRAAVQRES